MSSPWKPSNSFYSPSGVAIPAPITPRGVVLGASSSEIEVLEQLVSEQQKESQQQQQQLGQLIQQQKITSYGVLQSSSNLGSIRHIQEIRFYSLMFAIIGVIVYLGTIYISINTRYKYLIDQVNQVISAGAYSRSSAWYIAFAYEYPAFDWKFLNKSFPASVVYAYYTQEFQMYMVANQNTYLQQMLQFSERGFNDPSAGLPNAEQILCQVVGWPNCITECEHPCPGPNQSGLADYAGSALGLGAQGLFIGEMLGGPVGAVVGGLVGAAAGGLLTWGKNQQASSQCKQLEAQTHCIPGPNQAC